MARHQRLPGVAVRRLTCGKIGASTETPVSPQRSRNSSCHSVRKMEKHTSADSRRNIPSMSGWGEGGEGRRTTQWHLIRQPKSQSPRDSVRRRPGHASRPTHLPLGQHWARPQKAKEWWADAVLSDVQNQCQNMAFVDSWPWFMPPS